MNRKISTLFTAGLLMAGSLCGSAWAQTISDLAGLSTPATAATELKDGQKYLLVNSSNEAYGQDLTGSTLSELTANISTDVLAGKDDVKKYVWTVNVTEALGQYAYTFTNESTGKLLRIGNAYAGIEANTTVADASTHKNFVFESSATETAVTAGKYSASNKFMYVHEGNTSYTPYGVDWASNVLSVSSTVLAPTFYEVGSEEFKDAAELNALYNTAGFSFETKRYDSDQGDNEPNGNLFYTKRVVARYVSSPIKVDATSYPSYSGPAADMYIKPGMYFFTENAPSVAGLSDYKNWLNATILLVSSTETVEATNSGRAAGDGFALAEVKGSDLNFYQGSNSAWQTAGDEVSINNAKFRVQKSYTEDYPYELNVDGFRYRVQLSKAAHDVADVKLHVLKHNDEYYLTTTHATADQFIFALAPAGMKKGIELLNTEAKVAAYTIRVLSGSSNDVKSVYGKYLTSAVNSSSNFEFVAKAKVLSQLETPAYQWAISSVDGFYNVTFTNRETGKHFTASLFPQADLGENVYELSTTSEKVTAIYVDENTYRETEGGVANMQRLIVELTKAEVDPMAGFLNVDDETLVTMAFSRDDNETSNKWYTAVTDNGGYRLNADGKFVNNASSAAQWQLVKGTKRTIIERSFVYNKDNRVTVQARGDKAYAYAYQLQYINDGIETEEYFPAVNTLGSTKANEPLVGEGVANFIIKQAADGSVYLIKVSNTSASVASVLGNPNTASVVDARYYTFLDECHYITPSSVYAWPVVSNDLLLKTYLIEEAPEISYPATEGHISLVSELGNYISMNEDRDGIVVNENQYSFYLQVTDESAVVPSFYISNKGTVEDGNRLFLFNPKDSIDYYVAAGTYDRKYQWAENVNKAIFKPATLQESKDTLTTVVKGNVATVAMAANDEGVLGGLDRFKVQIIQDVDNENLYLIRSVANKASYLYGLNDKLAWGSKAQAMKFTIAAGDPTSNESIADAAEGVKVIAGNGTVEIQGAAGKNVVISNILGKVVASTVLTSDDATITVPAGIVVVAVEGEAAVKAAVK